MTHILLLQPDSMPSAAAAALCSAFESEDVDILVADSIDDALTAIDTHPPDLVLLDTFLPPHEADDLVGHLRILSAAGHVQVVYVPLIQTPLVDSESFKNRRGRRWWDHLFPKESGRSEMHPLRCDAGVFTSDVATYLSRSHAMRASGKQRSRHHERPDRLERRHAQRCSPIEASIASAVRLATTPADLINLSSGGALVQSAVRPDTRRRSRMPLTLYLPSGEEVRRTGRPIRCDVRPTGEAGFLYNVAFQFDESLSLGLPTCQPQLPSAADGESLGSARTYRALLPAGSLTKRS